MVQFELATIIAKEKKIEKEVLALIRTKSECHAKEIWQNAG